MLVLTTYGYNPQNFSFVLWNHAKFYQDLHQYIIQVITQNQKLDQQQHGRH